MKNGLLPIAGEISGLRRFLFGVPALDPSAIAAAVILILILASSAAYLPAGRAAGIDPMRALRHEVGFRFTAVTQDAAAGSSADRNQADLNRMRYYRICRDQSSEDILSRSVTPADCAILRAMRRMPPRICASV